MRGPVAPHRPVMRNRMGKYILRRLLQAIPVFFGATLLIYAMVFLMPGDPVAALGGDRGLNPAIAAQIRAEYNLDKPLIVQYLLYLKGKIGRAHV